MADLKHDDYSAGRWLGVGDVADYYNVSRTTVYNWEKQQLIKFEQMGPVRRIHENDLPWHPRNPNGPLR